jgi:hypothetical protein
VAGAGRVEDADGQHQEEALGVGRAEVDGRGEHGEQNERGTRQPAPELELGEAVKQRERREERSERDQVCRHEQRRGRPTEERAHPAHEQRIEREERST